MITRIALIAAWLLVGATVVGGLYWGFLNTPEANVLMLLLSAVLVLLMTLATGIVVNVAVLVARGETIRASVASAAGRIGWFLLVVLPVIGGVWVIARGDAWVARHSGEISAWFIAQFGWADITPIFLTQSYLSVWLRWVVLPVMAIAALSTLVKDGWRMFGLRPWLRVAWHWRTLLVATIAFVVLVALPWRAAFWQPQHLPLSWVQPTLAALRLGLVALAVAIGYAVILFMSAGGSRAGDARSSAPVPSA